MRKLLISAAVIALFGLPVSVWAQPDHEHGERGHGGGGSEQHGGPQGAGPGPQQQHGGPPGGGHEHGGGPQPAPNPSFSRGPNGGENAGRMTSNPGYSRGPGGSENSGRVTGNPGYRSGPSASFNRPAQEATPNYSRGPNGGGNIRPQNGPNLASRPSGSFNRPSGGRHDFRGFTDFHQNFNAPRHFHAGDYHRPAGWYPHHWVFGEYLPALFWARNYWLIDFMDYGLPPPPYGAVWVRVGDDALLIDQDTGEIITVEYGVFY